LKKRKGAKMRKLKDTLTHSLNNVRASEFFAEFLADSELREKIQNDLIEIQVLLIHLIGVLEFELKKIDGEVNF